MRTKTITEAFGLDDIEEAVREHFKLPKTADIEFLVENVADGDSPDDYQMVGATATYLSPPEK
jgi:uncharacterized protein YbaP (TraB family)